MKKIIWIASAILAVVALLFNSIIELFSVVVGLAFGAPDSAEWPTWLFAGFVIALYYSLASIFCRIFANRVAKQALLEFDN